MSIYGTIPRVGDRVVILTHAYPGAGNDPVTAAALVSLSTGLNRRHQSGMERGGLMLVEGVVSAASASADAPREQRETYLSYLTVMCDGPVPGRVGYVAAYYGYFGMLSAVNNMRLSQAFADFNDDELRLLLKFCWPQLVASGEYVKLVKDLRGDDAIPASVQENIDAVRQLTEQLGIRYVPFSMENNVFTVPGYPTSDDEAQQEEVFLQGINQDFRQGLAPLSPQAPAAPTRRGQASSPVIDWSAVAAGVTGSTVTASTPGSDTAYFSDRRLAIEPADSPSATSEEF